MIIRLALTVGLLLAIPFQVFSAEERDYFPLSLSRSWSYEYSKKRTVTTGQDSSVVSRIGTVADTVARPSAEFQAPDPVLVLERRIAETDLASRTETVVQSDLHYSVGNNGVLLHGQKISGLAGHSAALIPFNPPRLVLKLPLDTMPKGRAPGNPGATFRADPKPKSQSFETVRVKAGTFESCLKVEFEGPISGALPNGLPIKSGTVIQIAWYAKGIGVVKTVEIRELEVGIPDGRTAKSVEIKKQELVEYSKGK